MSCVRRMCRILVDCDDNTMTRNIIEQARGERDSDDSGSEDEAPLRKKGKIEESMKSPETAGAGTVAVAKSWQDIVYSEVGLVSLSWGLVVGGGRGREGGREGAGMEGGREGSRRGREGGGSRGEWGGRGRIGVGSRKEGLFKVGLVKVGSRGGSQNKQFSSCFLDCLVRNHSLNLPWRLTQNLGLKILY